MEKSLSTVRDLINNEDLAVTYGVCAAGKANPFGDVRLCEKPFFRLRNGGEAFFYSVNAAFAALPAGTVDTLLKPESKPTLTKVLTYHVVAGKYDAAALSKMIADGKGMASLKTVAGGTLTAKASGNAVMVTDEKGGTATVTIADVYQSNGVIHVVDKVLLPNY